jgi:hypothetical protein
MLTFFAHSPINHHFEESKTMNLYSEKRKFLLSRDYQSTSGLHVPGHASYNRLSGRMTVHRRFSSLRGAL